MRKLNLLPKTFIYTFGFVSIILIFTHSLLYVMLPNFYLQQKNEEANERLTAFIEKYQGETTSEILTKAQKYALSYNVNLDLLIAGKTYTFHGYTPVEIQFNEGFQPVDEVRIVGKGSVLSNALIFSQKTFKNEEGQMIQIQLMMNVQPVDEARQIIFKLLPITLSLGLFVALLAAYFYSRMVTKPIKKILEVTKKMETLTPDAYNVVTSEDELGLLAENINDLYETLWNTIDSLEEQIQVIENLEEEKIEFLRGASHELKTPLTSLSILLENMQLNVGKYQDHDFYLGQARMLTQNLAAMIQQILESTQMHPSILGDKKNLEIKKVFLEVAQRYEIIARSKKLQFQFRRFEEQTVEMNATQLEKVFSNLLANAVYYTSEGGKIEVECFQSVFRLKNETPEIPESILQQLVQPFYRPDFSRDKKDGGTGLGLYLVKTILENNQIPYQLKWQEGFFIFEIHFI